MKYLALIIVVAAAAPLLSMAAPGTPNTKLAGSKYNISDEIFYLEGLDKLFAEFCVSQYEYWSKQFPSMSAHPENFLSESTADQSRTIPEEICKKVSSIMDKFGKFFITEVQTISARHDNAQVKDYLKGVSYENTACSTTVVMKFIQKTCKNNQDFPLISSD